jgi:hypothetical protein
VQHLFTALVFLATLSPEASSGFLLPERLSSEELLVILLLAIAVPTAAFIRPFENPDRWPFSETARHFCSMLWVGVVSGIVGFSVEALNSAKVFETATDRLANSISAAELLLFFVFLMVHLLPLLVPVTGEGRRWLTVACVVVAVLCGILTGVAGAKWSSEVPHESIWSLMSLWPAALIVWVARGYARRLVGGEQEPAP